MRSDPWRLFEMIREHPLPWSFAFGGMFAAFVIWFRVLDFNSSGSSYVDIGFIGMPGALIGYGIYRVTLGRPR